jgi:hypothetical protein
MEDLLACRVKRNPPLEPGRDDIVIDEVRASSEQLHSIFDQSCPVASALFNGVAVERFGEFPKGEIRFVAGTAYPRSIRE